MSNNSFYEMVKKWTVNDCFNPGIKSEVIWDMLLSDFIPDLICFNENKTLGSINQYKLLAKEFPIDNESSYGLRNAKVDYIVARETENASNGTIYLVELKTSNDSFDKNQYERYCNYINFKENAEHFNEYNCGRNYGNNYRDKLWRFYLKVLNNNIKQSFLEVDIGKDKQSSYYNHRDYRKHVKFVEQVKKITKEDTLLRYNNKKEANYDKLNELIAKYINYDIKLVYLSIDELTSNELKNDNNNIMKIAINNINKEDFIEQLNAEQGECWDNIIGIIDEINKLKKLYKIEQL